MRRRRGRHDPGRVVRDLAVMLACGGDSVSDMVALGGQERLFGGIASQATARRAIAWIAEDPARLARLRAARARARARAWELGVRPERMIIDIDATLTTAYSQKGGAHGNFKGGFGHHPFCAYLDGSREALGAILRPGNAGSNTGADQVAIVELGLGQLPREMIESESILVRADGAGSVHELLDYLREGQMSFSVGFDLTAEIRQQVIDRPDQAWALAVCQDGSPRTVKGEDGELVELAHVTELTDVVDLDSWPEGSRLIARRERLQGEEQLRSESIAPTIMAPLFRLPRCGVRTASRTPRSRSRRDPSSPGGRPCAGVSESERRRTAITWSAVDDGHVRLVVAVAGGGSEIVEPRDLFRSQLDAVGSLGSFGCSRAAVGAFSWT
jgi:Transposase DDE domain group 1